MSLTTIPALVSDPTRLAALESYAILDTPAEPGFDGIVHLACRLCAVPVALVSLVAGDRQWFKARVGFPPCETDLNSSVCAHSLAHPDELLVIPDLTADPRTSINPLVTSEPFIRFYAGAPLVSSEGQVLGSLCVIDKAPRPGGLTVAQADDLRLLAQQVTTQLELRRAIAVRDAARNEEGDSYRAREALRGVQAATALAEDNLDAVLTAIVQGAMRAVPAAEGGVIELLDGDVLEYRAAYGSLASHLGLRLALTDSLAGHCVATRTPQLMKDAVTDPRIRGDLIHLLGLRSAIAVPVTRGSTVLGALKLQASTPAAFSSRDLELVSMFVGEATSGLAADDAREAARLQDIYWHSLFARLSEGFIVAKVLRDVHGHITDWRYIEVNPAFGELIGVAPETVIGRTIREAFPGIEDEWITGFATVVETGEPITFTRHAAVVERWYEGRAFKLEDDRFGVIFLDVTARIQADARRAALLAIGDQLRDLTSVPDMTRAAAEIVGRTLRATRAGFGRIEGDVEHVIIEPDWTAPGMSSIAGRHRFDDYGDIRAHLRRGEPLIISDVTTDARTRADPGPMLAIGIGALANMPVRERGQTVAVFIIHDVKPRVWAPEELAFLRNVADRLEVGVARVRAEEMQTVLNHELAHRLKNTLAVVQSIAAQTLRGVAERDQVEAFDRRLLALSHAHDVLLHKSWTAARMRVVMESVLSLQADLDRFALDGPDLDISPDAAMSLSLLLHELATNALKYGALSARNGKVRLTWSTEDGQAPALVLKWIESGGPAITAPSGRTGFGSKLIRMGLLGTRSTDLRYERAGLHAEFRAPLAKIQLQVH